MFKHYKPKPNFPIIKDNKTKDMAACLSLKNVGIQKTKPTFGFSFKSWYDNCEVSNFLLKKLLGWNWKTVGGTKI